MLSLILALAGILVAIFATGTAATIGLIVGIVFGVVLIVQLLLFVTVGRRVRAVQREVFRGFDGFDGNRLGRF